MQKTKILSRAYSYEGLPVVNEDDERFNRNVKNCGLTGLLLGLSASAPSMLRYEFPTEVEVAFSMGLAYLGMVLSLALCTKDGDSISVGEYSLGVPLKGAKRCGDHSLDE